METAALVFGCLICGLAWHRRRLMIENTQLRRQLRTLEQLQHIERDARDMQYRVYFAPYDTREPDESWIGHNIPPGDYRASGAPYNVFGRGYLN